MGLSAYKNNFLQKNLGLNIKDLDKIYNKISCYSFNKRKHTVEKICTAFDSGDSLLPLEVLSSEFLKDPAIEQFLTSQKPSDKIKKMSDLIIPIITLIVSLIGVAIKA
jgi:hypothetical protein